MVPSSLVDSGRCAPCAPQSRRHRPRAVILAPASAGAGPGPLGGAVFLRRSGRCAPCAPQSRRHRPRAVILAPAFAGAGPHTLTSIALSPTVHAVPIHRDMGMDVELAPSARGEEET